MGSIPCSSEMISQNCKRPEIDYFMHESFIVLSIIRDAVRWAGLLSGCIKFACYDYTITCFQKTIHGALLELREEELTVFLDTIFACFTKEDNLNEEISRLPSKPIISPNCIDSNFPDTSSAK